MVCLLRFWLRNAPLVKVIGNPISDGIVFKNELTHLRRKRVEKSQAILEHLKTFRSSISTGKPEQLLSLMCVSWSRAYGLCGLSLYTSNDLTYNSIRFKKPLDIFWPANSKKRFRRLFSYDFGCKQKALSDFLASSSSWKRANTGKPA